MNDFVTRHIGTNTKDQKHMLAALGIASTKTLIAQAIPTAILSAHQPQLPTALEEPQALARLQTIANRNQVSRSMIGMGYYDTHTPTAIRRNLLENPGWYTAYTPYQAEISQGRLEILLLFQHLICELTAMEIANASLLDEATACAEAMSLMLRLRKDRSRKRFYIGADCHPQNLAVVRTRAAALNIEITVGASTAYPQTDDYFGALLHYPESSGALTDPRAAIAAFHASGALVAIATDLLALTLLIPPGEINADIALGSTQRYGMPMGYGGPHAAFFATRRAYQRQIPGRIIGISRDTRGKHAYRMALQTREQHIRRDKATSNICTAQALPAMVATLYAIHHGATGLKRIATKVHQQAIRLANALQQAGYPLAHQHYFDTLCVITNDRSAIIRQRAQDAGVDLRPYAADRLGIACDETTTEADLAAVLQAFAPQAKLPHPMSHGTTAIPAPLRRNSSYLTHPQFSRYHSETAIMRWLRERQTKDIALDRAMIPLGSCTMKLNAASEMTPILWPQFCNLHPFAPRERTHGYQQLITELQTWLKAITGFAAFSLQPNAGAQGEYAGLLAIRRYHTARHQAARNICLIPASAHGTNPASAIMAGMQVITIPCDPQGNIDRAILRTQAKKYADTLAALMITYPSTHGIFETAIHEICSIVHQYGGQVYMDGANFNAMVGLIRPAEIGADVMHLNLHKTFCIPHGGGGPGMGPIGVQPHLADYLPDTPTAEAVSAVSAAPYGSAMILPITWMYIAMMGAPGLKAATIAAILHANYLAMRLQPHYPVLFHGEHGRVAHECIIDLRPFKNYGVTVEDVAKRLIDYGFHAPTVAFPVADTMMIEPTESEPLEEMERFIAAMIAIREEIRELEEGQADSKNNLLKNAP